MDKVELKVLGTPQIEGIDRRLPLGKPLAALIYVALENRAVPRDELAGLLWPNASRTRSRQSVRQALSKVRQFLGPNVFLRDDPIELDRRRLSTDATRFIEALGRGDWEDAIEVWRAPFLDGFRPTEAPAWERWAEERGSVLEQSLIRHTLNGVTQLFDEGDPVRALTALDRAIKAVPRSVPLRAHRVEALLSLGRASEAATELARCQQQPDLSPKTEDLLERLAARALVRQAPGPEEPDLRALSVPFVGRERELRVLLRAWVGAVRGTTQVVHIEGASGLGKTRLAQELRRHAEDKGGVAVRVAAFSAETGHPRAMLGDLVRLLLQLPGASGIGPRADAALQALVPSASQRTAASSRSGHSRERVPLGDALVHLVEEVAYEAPLFVILDDLQWADSESLGIIAYILRRLTTAPVLFLTLAHTAEHATVEVLPTPARTLRLYPLESGEVGQLIVQTARLSDASLSEEIGERCARVTGGSPLVLKEMLYNLHDAGAINAGDGGYILDVEALLEATARPVDAQNVMTARLGHLTGAARAVSLELATSTAVPGATALQASTGLSEPEVTAALQELVRKEIAELTEDGRISFANEEMRRAATPVGGGARTFRKQHAVIATVTAALLLSAAIPIARRGSTPADFPYGRGHLVVPTDQGVQSLEAPSTRLGAWAGSPAPGADPGMRGRFTRGPFRTTSGALTYVGSVATPDAPPYATIWRDNGWDPVWTIDGDANGLGASPDGRLVLVNAENLDTDVYDTELVAVDVDTGEGEVVFRRPGTKVSGSWSPDGTRILTWISGVPDSFAVVTPSGRVVRTFALSDHGSDFHSLSSWCSDSRHFVALADIHSFYPRVLFVDSETGLAEHVELPGSHTGVGCIGDGQAIATVSLGDAQNEVRIYDRQTLSLLETAPIRVVAGSPMFWVPASASPVVRSVHIPGDSLEIGWGEETLLSAYGRFTDNIEREVPVRWESSDPSVASVSSEGVIVGNRAGDATVVATYADWLTAESSISVKGLDRGEDLHWDFSTGDLSDWNSYGDPLPQRVIRDGEGVLFLNGDGRYSDGTESRRTFQVQLGFTAETEFRMPLSRDSQQAFSLCVDGGNSPVPHPDSALVSPRPTLGFCLRYPWSETAKLRTDEVAASYMDVGKSVQVPVPEGFDSREWTHIGIQVRPDGHVTLIHNREPWVELPRLLSLPDSVPWRVRLSGHSVGTELLVRYVTVWEGTRY